MTGERTSSFFLMLLALYICRESLNLGIGGMQQPKSGFFPMVGGILLFIFSTIVFINSLSAKSGAISGDPDKEKGSFLLAGCTAAALVVFNIILEYFGFILASFALVLFLSRLFENKKWWVTLLTAGVVSLAFYFLFTVFLKSELPKGVLGLSF